VSPSVDRRRTLVGLGLLVLAAAVVFVVATQIVDEEAPPRTVARPDRSTREASERFLGRYMDANGRVIRRDQGGDTVSEGQAYAMLIAAGIGDRRSFRLAWGWARSNLQRSDGLLSYSRKGAVVEHESASDADVDAARALALAADRFGEPGYRRDAARIAAAVVDHETAGPKDSPTLVAGPWATSRPQAVNPSYFSPRAFGVLARLSDAEVYAKLAASSRRILSRLVGNPLPLPPDWAKLRRNGKVKPSPPPSDKAQSPRFGPDAARIPIRYAESCDGADRRLAARFYPFFDRAAREGAPFGTSYDPRGAPLDTNAAALTAVAAAAAADAAGDRAARESFLSSATETARRYPTYYGDAWVALGRLMLTDELGGCSQ
jgi:endo-1,4-beta-D-glucanase Y